MKTRDIFAQQQQQQEKEHTLTQVLPDSKNNNFMINVHSNTHASTSIFWLTFLFIQAAFPCLVCGYQTGEVSASHRSEGPVGGRYSAS